MIRMIMKAELCDKLGGMIDAGHILMRDVNRNHQIGRIMHDMIMLIILVDGARRGARQMSNVWYVSRGVSFPFNIRQIHQLHGPSPTGSGYACLQGALECAEVSRVQTFCPGLYTRHARTLTMLR